MPLGAGYGTGLAAWCWVWYWVHALEQPKLNLEKVTTINEITKNCLLLKWQR